MAQPRDYDNKTADGQHIDFGTGDDVPMPPGFNAPDNAATCPGSWGHITQEDDTIDTRSGN